MVRFLTVLWLILPIFASAQREPPFELPPPSELAKLQSAIIYTSRGQLRFQLFPQEAPWHVANLKFLADKGYYRNKIFHIHHPGYIIQGGAPSTGIDPGPGWDLQAEFGDRKHRFGTLGMARLPNSSNPERRSHGGQFHIILDDSPQLDRDYTIVGELIGGSDVLKSLERGDTIVDLRVFVRP